MIFFYIRKKLRMGEYSILWLTGKSYYLIFMSTKNWWPFISHRYGNVTKIINGINIQYLEIDLHNLSYQRIKYFWDKTKCRTENIPNRLTESALTFSNSLNLAIWFSRIHSVIEIFHRRRKERPGIAHIASVSNHFIVGFFVQPSMQSWFGK